MKCFMTKTPQTGHDEDYAYIEDGIAVVCDGLGGLGSSKVMYNGSEVTAAWLTSRICCAAVKDFFANAKSDYWSVLESKETLEEKNNYIKSTVNALKDHIDQFGMNFCKENGILPQIVRSLPATMALALINERDDISELTVIWAGDSRVYSLCSANGLQQLSLDDTKTSDFDAHFQIGSCEMSNCIEIGKPFYLNYKYYELPKCNDRIVFCCSDGYFDGLKSIMDLEYFFLRAIMQLTKDDPLDKCIEILVSDYSEGRVYREGIIDDTTIAGFILSQLSAADFVEMYAQRYDKLSNVHELIYSWQKSLMEIEEARPTVLEDNAIKQKFKKTALTVCEVMLSDQSLSDESQIDLREAILELPVFTRYKNKLDDIKNKAADEFKNNEVSVRIKFAYAFLDSACNTTKNLKNSILRCCASKEQIRELLIEFEEYRTMKNGSEELIKLQTSVIDSMQKLSILRDRMQSCSAEDFDVSRPIKSLFDNLAKLEKAVNDLSASIDSLKQFNNVNDDIDLKAKSIVDKFNAYGISNDAYNAWKNAGMHPLGVGRIHDELQHEAAALNSFEATSLKKEKELKMMLQGLLKFSSEQITSQFVFSRDIVFNANLDNESDINELRVWLTRHIQTKASYEAVRHETDSVWVNEYSDNYTLYLHSLIGGKSE